MAGLKVDGTLVVQGDDDCYVLIRRYIVVNGARQYTSQIKIFFNTGDIKTTGEIKSLQGYV